MAYTKTNWANGVTPINEDNLNKIEDELEAVDKSLKYIGFAPDDLNDARQFGIYHINNAKTNKPTSALNYGMLIVYENRGGTWNPTESSSGSSWIWQEYRDTRGQIYVRHATNKSSEWADWQKNMTEEVTIGTYTAGSSSDVTITTGAGNTFIRKVGKVVTLQVRFKPLIKNGGVKILTVPEGYRPSQRMAALAYGLWGTTNASKYQGVCSLLTTGALHLNNDTGNCTNADMMVSMTYITD